MGDDNNTGLSSVEALTILSDEIASELKNCSCRSHGRQGFIFWLSEAYSHKSFSSTFRWPSILLTVVCLIVFIAGYHLSNDRSLLVQALLLFLCLIANVLIVGFDARFYHKEVHEKAAKLVRDIRALINSSNPNDLQAWKTGKFCPQMHLPQSPCISLQWTIRDGNKVNLPTSLLVKGDTVLLCPGAMVPGHCRNLEPINESNEKIELKAGELYVPNSDQYSTNFTMARLRKAITPTKFIILETPYIFNLRLSLEPSWSRPRTLYDKERHTIIAKYIEQIIIPVIWFIVLITSLGHYGYLKATDRDITSWANSAIFVVLRPALAILPLIPIALPTSWLLLNTYGVANLLHISTNSESITSENAANLRIKQGSKDLYFDDIDGELGSVANITFTTAMGWRKLTSLMIKLLLNRSGELWRSANLLQVLGSITALCCVDKKGILSWPNPAADKVFILTSPAGGKKHSAASESLIVGSDNDNASDVSGSHDESRKMRRRKSRVLSRPEVLDLTPDPHNSLGLQFDDPEWFRYLPNLKPLGLAILLNTCNSEVEEEYTRFCDHVACESLHNEAAVPVVNKRCLCELARQIGFTASAVKDYQYLFQMGMFRHVKPEVIQKGKLARSLNIPKLKMPFPHVASSVIKESITNTYQVFSQGTGDLILDVCTEYWDGHDLRPLTDLDRKRILDFYHRTSLTAYSMPFSYVPLTTSPDKRFIDHYLELPPDSALFSVPKKQQLDNSARSLRWNDNNNDNLQVQNIRIDHYLSTESLTVKEKESRSTSSSPQESVALEAVSTQLNNQVFIGMVTMQYQACPDFVQLVEQLEKACIRFVHFSKENELRSRVFSEKMGLESGWNCHISLLSDHPNKQVELPSTSSAFPSSAVRGSKTSLVDQSNNIHSALLRCQSAPSSVNLDTSTVKFVEGETVVDITRAGSSQEDISVGSSDSSDNEDGDAKVRLANISPSTSRVTESTGTDTNNAPIAFDMHNRAKLPKGIENIRPHLDQVDNVPLLVSLFTDCTPATTTEMIEIMQDYGEVVCVIGSSANSYNMPIFIQADASISIEPLYPELCVTRNVIDTDEELVTSVSDNFLSPTELAKQLNSLPCSLALHREDNFSFSRLIGESRHYMINIRNSLQFFLCCCLSLSLAQVLTSLMFLPPLLSTGHVLWLVCVILPSLSFSLMGTPYDPQVMTIATGKNLNLSKDSIFYFLFCYLIKFSPSMFIVVAGFAIMVRFSCSTSTVATESPCWMFIDIVKEDNDFVWSSHLLLSQTFVCFLLVLYFMTISIGFVHRCHLLWQRSPFTNRWWMFMCVALLIAHIAFSWIEVVAFLPSTSNIDDQLISAIPVPLAIVGLLWPLLLICINTLVKRHEIRAYNRQQRRARLDFNTKLGMNSPF